MRSTRLLAFLLALLWAVPSEAAISRIGSCAAQTTSCTFSVAPTSGDAIIVFAHKDGATSAPTIPTSGSVAVYHGLAFAGANTNSAIIGVKISDGTETTTGTWTGATSIAAVIYRGANVAPFGAFAAGGASSATLAYNTFTLDVTTGTSWVVGFAAHRTATNVTSAPTNMTLVTSATDIAVSDTNAGVSSWSTQTTGVNATSGWRSYTIELLAQTGEDTTKLYVDDYVNMNTADANGTALTGAIMTTGTQGPDTTWACTAAQTTFAINASEISAPATIHKRSPSTDYAVGSTTKSINYDNDTNFIDCGVSGLTTRRRGAISIAGYISFGVPNEGVSSELYDLWRIENADGNFCVMQLDSGQGVASGGYAVNIESNPAGSTGHSTYIVLTPGTRYWVTMTCNYQKGEAQLAVYSTSGVQVGSTVTRQLHYTSCAAGCDGANGAYVEVVHIGNMEIGTNGTNNVFTKFEHTILDYSAATFPLGPAVTGGGSSTVCTRSLRGFGCDE
jgi:hypothetical protein